MKCQWAGSRVVDVVGSWKRKEQAAKWRTGTTRKIVIGQTMAADGNERLGRETAMTQRDELVESVRYVVRRRL